MDHLAGCRVLPACDQCHTKKTRCDRQDPCALCVAGDVPCLRRRRRQTSRNKNTERIDAVLDRMAQLEQTIKSSTTTTTQSPVRRDSTVTSAPSEIFSRQEVVVDESPDSTQYLENVDYTDKRRRQHSVTSLSHNSSVENGDHIHKKRARISTEEEEGQSPEDKMLANIDLKRYFRVHRQQNTSIDREQQSAMESAIRLAKSVAMADTPLKLNRDQRANFYDSSMYPSAEFLCLMLNESARSTPISYSLVLFSTVSQPLLEEMAFSLINHEVHGQERVQFLICVNHAAHAFLIAHSSDESPAMRRELRKSQQKYLDNMITAIAHLDTSVRAERSLMYALQSAAMIMQETGRMRQCWRFNSLSCQVGAAISKAILANGDSLSTDDLSLMRITHIRSFAFNSALSANMYQPACSARLLLDRSVLDTQKPEYAMLDILLSFAEIQEVIIQETKNILNSYRQEYQIDVTRVANLKVQMRNIRMRIENYRTDSRSATDEFLRFEWLTINFVFYSMMTSITRLGATPNDYNAQFSGLENARQCLLVLKTLLEVWDQSTRPDLYACSLSWVIPLFPLRPIYFVFSNVIATSDALDFRILQEITDGLSKKMDSSPAVFEIHRLCSNLIDLYHGYVDRVSKPPDTAARVQMSTMGPMHGRDRNTRQITSIPSPILSGSHMNQRLFGESSQIDSSLDSVGDTFKELTPWDPLWLDQQLDWDPLSLDNVPDLFE